MLRRLRLFLTLFLGVSVFAQPLLVAHSAHALDSDIAISIYPSSQTIDLSPNQIYSGEITIANSGLLPFDVLITVTPYQVDSETYDPDFTTENHYTKLASWITLDETSYHIESGSTATVPFQIHVPADAVSGGQYAAIMARTESGLREGDTIQTIPQVAALIYGRINGSDMNPIGEIAEQEIPSFILGGNLEVSETVYNTGNVDFQVDHSVTITDFFTQRVLLAPDTKSPDGNSLGAATVTLLPSTSRKNTIVWENTPRLGVFRVRQVVAFLGHEYTNERIVICCPPWLILSSGILIILLILWIILAVRHRRKKRPQVF